MRKLKLLLAVCALFGVTAGFAKTDVTSTYLTNAGLASLEGWTVLDGTMGQGGYQDWKNDGDVPVIEFYHTWHQNPNQGAIGSTKTFNFSQKANLPAGYYRLAVNAFYREGGIGNGTNTKSYIYAGEKQQFVVGLNEGGLNGYTGSSDLYRAANAFSKGDFSNEFDFHVTEAGEIEIGFHGYIDTFCSWCILGPVTLWEYTAEDYMEDYRAKVAIATPLLTQKMNASVLQALQAAIVEESTLVTVDDVQNAVSLLTNVINDANNSIAFYQSLKSAIDAYDAKCIPLDSYGIAAVNETDAAGAKSAYENGTATDGTAEKAALDAAFIAGVLATKQPGNGLDMTPYVTNSDFNGGTTAGWTINTPYGGNCTIQGGSRMEYWAGNSSNRALASFNISQELTDLPAGVYTVSADMYNSLNGETAEQYGAETHPGFSPTCGVYGVSNNEEVALVTEEGDVLKTYTTGEILVFRGRMTIGTKNTVTPMAARWFLFDNVKLTYARQLTPEEIAANIQPESVTLDPSSVNLTIYETATLVPTVLPENANDKTVSWSSADPTIATVDANGVVTAVGFGSTTITATANGADGVSGAATVTVTDATPVDAPSFYSEVAAGDFYIVNAATGKFLGGANSWGTQASLIEHGIPFSVAMNDGKYTLDSHTYQGNKHFFDGTYVDAASTNLYIVSVGDGKYSISTGENSNFVTAKPGTTVVDNSAANSGSVLSHWYFLSKRDRDKMLASASTSSPADATYYVADANFSRNYSNGWTGSFTRGGNNDNMNAKVENAAADVYQIIENIPNGTYTARVQAVSSGTAKFYVNDVEADIDSKDDVTNQTTASNAFGAGFFWKTLQVTVTDRTLKIGVKSDDTDKVLYFDNFELLMTNYKPVMAVSVDTHPIEVTIGSTAQIQATTIPVDASFNAITFTSNNEEVATVDATGLVTPVSEGTAIVTVSAMEMESGTSTLTQTINVTVVSGSYTEAELPESYYVNDGATRTVYTATGENIIKNGAFEYPNGYYGWKNGAKGDLSSEKFDIVTDESENKYLQAKNSEGAGGAGSISTAWEIEEGKTYVFGFKAKANKEVNAEYLVPSMTNTVGTETAQLNTQDERKAQTIGTSWTDFKYEFTNTDGYQYFQFRARWLANNISFDDFYLAEAKYTLEGNVDYAKNAIPTFNIGDEAFRIPQSAINAANSLRQGTATVEDVQAAYDAVTTLNVPDPEQAYHIIFYSPDHIANGYALTLIPNPAQTQGLYGLKYLTYQNDFLAQAFYFTHTTGNKYKLHIMGFDGNPRYLTTATLGYGTDNFHEGIRLIEDEDKALEIEIRSAAKWEYVLWNTLANKAIAHNGNNNNDMFTNNSATFSFNMAEKPWANINTTDAGYGTLMVPFPVSSLPTGVKAYTCSAIDGATLKLDEVTALEPNIPYIIEGAWEEKLTGDFSRGYQECFTEGLLTGTYCGVEVPVGSYVLQKQGGVVGFYNVTEASVSNRPVYVPANHAYLTAPSEARALYFNNATAIRAIEALTSGEAEIYNAAGARQNSLQKGVNIIKQGGKTFKVMVK